MVKSITKRWFFNSFAAIVVILIIIELLLSYSIKNFYYSGAEQIVMANATSIMNTLSPYYAYTDKEYSREVRNIIEGFREKDKMEVMAIDSNGEVAITTSGFHPDYNVGMPDYEKAKISEQERSTFYGTLPSGESILAMTVMLPEEKGDYTAIRLITSLSEINKQIIIAIAIITLIGIGVIFFVVYTSSYFIKSIVNPVGEIGISAKKIANGNFDIRIKKKFNDEIGELCDTINEMAVGLANTEKMKNDFISSVSHELRTPLTAIKGWAETLTTCDADEQATVQKGLSVIINETTRLSQMVEELLDFSRLQSKRLTLNLVKLDIVAELCDAVIMFTERAKRDGIRLDFIQDEDFVIINGDKNRLRQVFVNIIDNALKYSDPNDCVTVSSKKIGDRYSIKIEDTGCGISKEDLPKIKQKFYKANSTRRGSGIGLAVALELVDMHGGDMDIKSELGEGTTVIISLPLQNNRKDDKKVDKNY